jgi:hypothetical protein
MSMHFEFDHDVQSVFDLLTDPDFLVDRCLELGELEASCEVDTKGDATVISLSRTLERDLPRVLAKVFDPVQTIHMTETWKPDGDGGFTGDYTFDVQGQPVSVSATFELYPTEDGCCYSIEHRAKAKVPLLGGQIEKFVRAQAKDGCLAELEYLQQSLG